MRVTKKGISKKILDKFSLNAEVSVMGGCGHFISNEIDLSIFLLKSDDNCIMISNMNQLSYSQWMEEFLFIVKDFKND